jgi:hypothetical protein
MSNPHLPSDQREALVKKLMNARRDLRGKRSPENRAAAREAVDEAKRALGERGPPWWTDGAPDFNRRMATNTPYGDWYAGIEPSARDTVSREPQFVGVCLQAKCQRAGSAYSEIAAAIRLLLA